MITDAEQKKRLGRVNRWCGDAVQHGVAAGEDFEDALYDQIYEIYENDVDEASYTRVVFHLLTTADLVMNLLGRKAHAESLAHVAQMLRGQVRKSVADNGLGLSEEAAARPFHLAEASIARRHTGDIAGLREFIEAREAEQGGGLIGLTELTLLLPEADPKAKAGLLEWFAARHGLSLPEVVENIQRAEAQLRALKS